MASSIGIWLYDAATGTEVALFTGHTEEVRSVAFSPDGTTLASNASSRRMGDNTVVLWDVASGQEKASLQHARYEPGLLVFSPDGTTLATAGSNFVSDGLAVGTLVKQFGCGMWPAVRRRPPSKGIRMRSRRRRFLRMGRPWPVGVGTIRFGCGMWPAVRRRRPFKGIRMWSRRWHFSGWDDLGQ